MRFLVIALLIAGCTPRPEAPSATATSSSAPAACTDAGTVVDSTAEERTEPPPAPASKDESREITIDSITIGNPLRVRGTARTFENQVVLRVRNSDGRVVAQTFTTSRGEMGQHNPYEAELWLTSDPGPHVRIEALEFSAKDGSERSLTARDERYEVAPIALTLFFPNRDCTAVETHRRMVPKSVSLARLAVEALIAGPTAEETKQGAAQAFPSGSAVRSINLRGGSLVVDFNERLQNVGGSCAAQMIRQSVTRTLLSLPGVRQVTITAGGNEALALQP